MNRAIRTCLAAAACAPILASCPSPLMDAVKAKVALEENKVITSFAFTMAKNRALPRDIVGTVDEASRTISIVVPKWVPLTGLVATFEFAGVSVTVAGAVQESGVTANNFGSPLSFTVTPVSGDPVTYTVTATSSDQGLRGGSIQGVPLQLDGIVDTVAGQASIFGDPTGCVIVPGSPEYVYITDYSYQVIWRIQNSAPYTCTVFAGALGEPGDADALSGPPTEARFTNPWGITSDGSNLFVADYGNGRIRKVELATGIVTTLASGLLGPMDVYYSADGTILYGIDADDGALQSIDMGGSGTVTDLVRFWDLPSATGNEYPVAVVRDANGKLYIADQGVNTIWQIDAETLGTPIAYAGTGNDIYGGWNNGAGASARFYYPSDLAIASGSLLVADSYNHEIREITIPGPTATVSTRVGNHEEPGCVDGLTSAIRLYSPQGISASGSTVIIAELGNRVIRKVGTSSGSTVAGTPPDSADGTGSAARFYVPRNLSTNGASVWIVDGFNHVLRSLDPATRTAGTLAGIVQAGQDPTELDGSSATARFAYPSGVVQVGSYLFMCDNVGQTIRKLDLVTGQVTTFAGKVYLAGYADGTGTDAEFYGPTSITSDGTYLYVADYTNQAIRRISIATAVVTTIAGAYPVRTPGDADDLDATGGTAPDARFRSPFGITTDGTNLYITDRSNNKIRQMVIETGVVSTLAGPAPGTRTPGYDNDVGNAARFFNPRGITTDGTYLYVADSLNHVIRRIDIATAAVDTVAGSLPGLIRAGEVDGTGTDARFNNPNGITSDGTALYVSDIGGNTIRRIR